MQVLFGLGEDDGAGYGERAEPVMQVPFDSVPGGGRSYHNADWRRSPAPQDLPMSTPLRRPPKTGWPLNGAMRGLGGTSNLSPEVAEFVDTLNRRANIVKWYQYTLRTMQATGNPAFEATRQVYARVKGEFVRDVSLLLAANPRLPPGALKIDREVIGDSLSKDWGNKVTVVTIPSKAPAGLGEVITLVVIGLVALAATVTAIAIPIALSQNNRVAFAYAQQQQQITESKLKAIEDARKRGDTAAVQRLSQELDMGLRNAMNAPDPSGDPLGLSKLFASLKWPLIIGLGAFAAWKLLPVLQSMLQKRIGSST